jgi:site-specific DNA-methyltransferase (adenine-specific)
MYVNPNANVPRQSPMIKRLVKKPLDFLYWYGMMFDMMKNITHPNKQIKTTVVNGKPRKKKRMNTDMIYNESCLTTMGNMDSDVVDLTVTSPPYDNMRSYNNQIGDNVPEFQGYSFPFEDIAKELYRVTKPGGVVVWVIGDATIDEDETGSSFRQALFFKKCGFKLFDTMIYAKPPRGASGNNKTYWATFEYMFVFSKGYPKTINLIKDRENKESRNGDVGTKRLPDGTRAKIKRGGYGQFGRRTNIWEYKNGKGHSTKDVIALEHPAIFPEKLAHDHIVSWSNPGELVYDPFMGSGTVAKMCLVDGRRYIGSETEKSYCNIAQKRIKKVADTDVVFNNFFTGVVKNNQTESFFAFVDKVKAVEKL